jgi:hypothetical protein
MIYIPIFIKIGSGIEKLIRVKCRHTERMMIAQAYYTKNISQTQTYTGLRGSQHLKPGEWRDSGVKRNAPPPGSLTSQLVICGEIALVGP